MKRRNLIATIFCGVLSIALLSSYTNSEHPITGKFENLKVFPKDIKPDSLMNLMHGYNLALGVKCNFCHAKNESTGKMDFASDAKKEKGFARHMITMTREINAKNFNWSNSAKPDTINMVTCAMCHRGATEPTKTLSEFVPKPREAQGPAHQ